MMRNLTSSRVAAAAVAAGAFFAITGGVASAATTSTGSLTVSPSGPVRVGAQVQVRLACDGDRGAVQSSALKLSSPQGTAGSYYYDATVRDVHSGNYAVTATCAGKKLSKTLTVLGSTGYTGISDTNGKAPTKQVRTVPKGSVNTGDGSLAARSGSSDSTLPWLAGGLTVVVLGGGAAAYTMVRKQRGEAGQ
jgi:hypothetical protein